MDGRSDGKIRKLPTILIDSREKLPYVFDGYETQVGTLATGDYSLIGLEDKVAVERKSKEDAYGCVGASRRRFVDCLRRLGDLDRAAIVIESNLVKFAVPPPRTKIDARMAVGSYVSWACQYRIPVFFADNREYAERLVVRFLAAYVKWRT